MSANDNSTHDFILINKAVKHAFGLDAGRRGSGIFSDNGLPVRYYFYPTWRSKLGKLLLFFIFSILAIRLSLEFDEMVIRGELFTIGNTIFFMSMPILMAIPGYILARVLLYIYNCRYIIDERGVEAQIGLVALRLRQIRLKYEDIRGVETQQSIVERILNIGTVEVGSAMTDVIEITMKGIANPRAVQILIGNERDKRLKRIVGNIGGKITAIDIDTRD